MDCWRSSSDESLQTATSCLSSLPQFCKEDETEDGKAGPLLCVELDGEVQNLVRRRRSPTDLTGGGISFGSGFTLGSGLGLAGIGTAFNAATASLFFWTGSCCSHWVRQPIGLCGPSCQARSTSPE